MNITGKIVYFDEIYHHIEVLKTKAIEKIALPSVFDIGKFVSIDFIENNISKIIEVKPYKSLPTKEIIFCNENEDSYNIEFMRPFSIKSCLSKNEAVECFNEFLKKSSCNYVQNLKYIENETDDTYEVYGNIGLYYHEQIAELNLSLNYNTLYANNLLLVKNNLEHEINENNNHDEVKKLCSSFILLILFIIFFMIFFAVI